MIVIFNQTSRHINFDKKNWIKKKVECSIKLTEIIFWYSFLNAVFEGYHVEELRTKIKW